MKKAVVGIVPLVDAGRESLWMLPAYMEGILEAGGLPVMLPLADGKEDIAAMAELCSGFLFTGGHDVSPEIYGEAPLPVCGEVCPARDRMEYPLLMAAIERGASILGICRGLQFINTALGGTLYQDLPAQRPSACVHHMDAPYDREAHKVSLTTGTPLAELLHTGEIGVNSCHHQGLKVLSPRLKAMAAAPDGLIEAAYMPEMRFAWAVQWHPEFSRKADANSQRIFDAFVRSCDTGRT